MKQIRCDQKISVIIPAWNEESTVGSIVQSVYARYKSLSLSVIVVDDASHDNTPQVGRMNQAVVISLAKHQGAWGAIQTGLRYALQKGANIMVTMDADGQHKPASIEALIQPVLTRQADVTIGSYPQRGSAGRHASWKFFRKISQLSVQDLTSGLKAYNRKAASMLLNPNMHLLDYQDLGTLLYLRKNEMKVVEVPVHMQSRQYGHSRVFNNWLAVCKYLMYSSILCFSKFAQTSMNKIESTGKS